METSAENCRRSHNPVTAPCGGRPALLARGQGRASREGEEIMQRMLAIALVAACTVAAATSASARNGQGGHLGRAHGPVIPYGPEPTPPFVSRIPAPLPPP